MTQSLDIRPMSMTDIRRAAGRTTREGRNPGPLDAATDQVFLDVPEPDRAALAPDRDLGPSPAFETARTHAGPAPHAGPASEIALDRAFGVTSFEPGQSGKGTWINATRKPRH